MWLLLAFSCCLTDSPVALRKNQQSSNNARRQIQAELSGSDVLTLSKWEDEGAPLQVGAEELCVLSRYFNH